MERVADFFRWLNDAHGVNLSIFYDALDRSRFLEGLWTTVELSTICTLLSLAIGVLGAGLQGSRFRPTRRAVQAYIQFFRNTPPLVQLFFFYFALGSYLRITNAAGLEVPIVSNFVWAVICLSLYAGSFNIEIFRAGIEAVPKETVEAAEALGYSRLKAYAHVILPLAFRICLPA